MLSVRASRLDALVAVVLFVASFGTAHLAMKVFRAEGIQPWFYQGNFEPAVMMACGRGFVSATPQTVPRELTDFLELRSNVFDCSQLSPSLPKTEISWNATWYYLYAATALVWRLTGISWTALDGLAALFAAVVTVALYGLFRLVTVWWLAAGVALLLMISPANLTQLLSLRDYSKAPFILLAVLVLALLVARPMPLPHTLAYAAVYGALVGFGYGFRGDLAVMVPFGIFVALFLLPGPFVRNVWRNGLAAALVALLFVVTAWPVLRGLSKSGCQFHYALLGLTTTLTNELGVRPALYRFGDHFLDTFIDLKVGDYANRMMNMPVPPLCSPDYDAASGRVFTQMATTFPADLVVHAYGSVLMVLRLGLMIPERMLPAAPFSSMAGPSFMYTVLNRLTRPIAFLGILLTLAAIGVAWVHSVRLGMALTLFVLFLTGYPAIEFEPRHWFQLRFIPWWSGLMVASHLLHRGRQGWTRDEMVRGVVGTAGLLVALAAALAAARIAQTRTATVLIAGYEEAPTEDLAFERDGSAVRVEWHPLDYEQPPGHRGSDLLVVALDPAECGGSGPLSVVVKYDADVPSHDMSSEIAVVRSATASGATRLVVPVFMQGLHDLTYLRFAGFDVRGAPAACISRVSRVTDRARLPLWVEAQLPPDWRERRLYQTLRWPESVGLLLSKLVS